MGVVFGIIGGILGILSAFSVMILGGTFGHLAGWGNIASLGFIVLISSVAGLLGAIKSKENRKYGWFMIGAGVAGFVFNFLAYVIPAVLLISGGIIVLTWKKSSAEP